MKENICTIPINDIFRETGGCPVCRMHQMLEEQYVEFITGSAMMAPDVRIQTNKTGFCHRHYSRMIKTGPRLSNALLLQTHIEEVRAKAIPKRLSDAPDKKQLEMIRHLNDTCYVCDRIDADILHLLKTVYAQYGVDEEFRGLYAKQDYICLDHYALVMAGASKKTVEKKYLSDFIEATNRLTATYMDALYDSVTKFTTMYDYRSRGQDFSDCKDSIEKAVKFLTKEDV